MKISKILIIFITIIFLITTSISFTSSVRAFSTTTPNQLNGYIIRGVPYVSQQVVIYCEYAAIAMVLRYYDINISQIEILYDVGGAYSFGYKPNVKSIISYPLIRPPYTFRFWTDETGGGVDDYKFMANLYGLSLEYISPSRVHNREKCWKEYWEKLKEFIREDIPVVTGVDPTIWPPYLECINLSIFIPAIFADTHVIVVVGFNETNKTVCVNDPGTGYFDHPEKGIYRWIDLKTFKRAVRRVNWELRNYKYTMLVFKKFSQPLSKDIIKNLVHQRNIQKMKGIKSSYDRDIGKIFNYLGINGLEKLENDIKSEFIPRIPMIKLIAKWYPLSYPFHDVLRMMVNNFHWEYITKENVSHLLLSNKSTHIDGLLLKTESVYWHHLEELARELENVILYNNTAKAIEFSRPIIEEMADTIDSIIAVEQIISSK